MRESPSRKDLGSYYTPAAVVRTLVSWATKRGPSGPVLDPSCGDGRFLVGLEDGRRGCRPRCRQRGCPTCGRRDRHGGLLRVGSGSESPVRRRCRQPALHPVSAVQWPGPARSTCLLRRARGAAVRPVFVVGAVRGRGLEPAEAGRMPGFRGSRRNRTRGLRARCRSPSPSFLRARRSDRRPGEAVPGPLGRLLASAGIRIRRTGRFHSLRSARCASNR